MLLCVDIAAVFGCILFSSIIFFGTKSGYLSLSINIFKVRKLYPFICYSVIGDPFI